MNKRRKLIVALGAGALAAPFRSFAQPQGKVWRVGILVTNDPPIGAVGGLYDYFLNGLRELGHFEGKNIAIEWRYAENKYERLPSLAAELVQLRVDVIVTSGSPAIRAAQNATATIPIVMGNSGDPVGSGFVKTLAHPGGNITGLSNLAGDISSKHLEMLVELVPKLSRVFVLVNSDNSSHSAALKSLQVAAGKTGITILPLEARNPKEIESAFSTMAKNNAGAVIIIRDGVFNREVRLIADLAAKARLPAVGGVREYAMAGGLMSYGQNQADNYRYVAIYVDKIFKGSKPADLPVEQARKLELFINRKSAKALGLKIPQSLLISADRVIE